MPRFWKLSEGPEYFSITDIIESIEKRLVFIGKDTHPKGRTTSSQAEEFVNADIGDYFYLTHGKNGIYLLGQFAGPANYISSRRGWIDRPFRLVKNSLQVEESRNLKRWWMPNHRSTFCRVPEKQLGEFEEIILKPYFDISLSDFKL